MEVNVVQMQVNPLRFIGLNEGELFLVSGSRIPHVKISTTQAMSISVTRHRNDGGIQAIDSHAVVTRVEKIDLYVMEGHQGASHQSQFGTHKTMVSWKRLRACSKQ
jgi:hypothetical protein